MPRKPLTDREKYRKRWSDCSTDISGGPVGALIQIDGCYYKVAKSKAWRWNIVAMDWVLSTKTAEYINEMFSTKSDK